MNVVQFRWVNPKTNKTHIIGQFTIDWRFRVGENFHFWVAKITCRMYKSTSITVHMVNGTASCP